MKRILMAASALALCCGVTAPAFASPADDIETYRSYFMKRFPGVPLQEFANGVYAIDSVSRESWEALEEFPPYEPNIDKGKGIWNQSFANGKSFSSCFPNGPAINGSYPYWDKGRGEVVTLALALNECLEANGEKPMKYKKGPIADLLAYIAYESRGQVTNVTVPSDDPRAMEAYEDGKRFYFTRRGQFNMSCAHCHFKHSGQHLRTDVLSPMLGHTTGWPVYRSAWGELGTLHRRYDGCNKQVRAAPFKAQGKEYRNLEYFMTHASNGIEFNGPSARK
ncbi:MAG: sulfur oxidation c-type cytochrome SoxA [Chromatiales bacterium]|nr:sulfur oxidation c-type cytochrome SoxA [Chromatiales bacterium]